MKITILATGSSGNCIAIQEGGACVLIDAGIAKTKIEKALIEHGIRVDSITGIFITHPHGDHIKGLPIANKYRIPVYIPEEEAPKISKVDDELVFPFNVQLEGKSVTAYSNYHLSARAFPVHHDSINPVGYWIGGSSGDTASICLDTGKVDDIMIEAMKDSDIYIIESNHDPKILEYTERPNSVKARILSHIGHLSNRQTADALAQLVTGKGERIYLTHLSSEANMPALAEMMTTAALKNKKLVKDKHYTLEVVT